MRDELVLNPNARLQPVADEQGPLGYRVLAPARHSAARQDQAGHPALQDTLVVSRDGERRSAALVDPSLVELLDRLHAADSDVELSDDDFERLADLKLMIGSDEVSALVEYLCLLAAPADTAGYPERTADVVLNPSLVLARDLAAPPGEIDPAIFAQRWSQRYPIAWVTDPRSGAWYPYHLDPQLHGQLQRLAAGGSIDTLDDPTVRLLIAAQILVPRARDDVRAAIMAHARESYRLNAYAVVPEVIPPLHLQALGRYYRELIREGYVPFGDPQVPRRYYAHSEQVMRYFHAQLTSMYEAVLGTSIKPSYCYLGSYLPGAELKRHIDREQCEFTASMQIDFAPSETERSGWKLYLEQNVAPRETFAVNLARGDTVIYRGRELAHYRDALPDGRSSTSFFLHYVHRNFAGSLE
jgi:hypothetical protein